MAEAGASIAHEMKAAPEQRPSRATVAGSPEVELFRAGYSTYAIAQLLGVQRRTVSRRLRKHGITPTPGSPPKQGRDERRRVAAERYEAGDTMEAIAANLGVTVSTIHLDLKAAGVVARRRGPRRIPLNENHPRATQCLHCGRTFVPDHTANPGKYCGYTCRSAGMWQRGVWKDPPALRDSGRARQRWYGRWNATKAPAPGGEPRGRPRAKITPEQRQKILLLADRGWGRRTIAAQVGLTENVVRSVLSSR
jgi:DNA-binding NarL/FixJ family response regulator